MRSAAIVMLMSILSACAQTPSQPVISQAESQNYKEMPASSTTDGYRQLRSTDELAALFGDRLIVAPGDYTILLADGTLGGEISDIPLQGQWQMQNGFLCTTLTAGPANSLKQPSDCKLMEIKGSHVRATGARGEGQVLNYQVQ